MGPIRSCAVARSSALAFLFVLLAAAPASAGSPGQLDSNFGHGGVVASVPGLDSNSVSAFLLQSDNRVVLADDRFALVRLMPDGSVDHGFGNDGSVRAAVGQHPEVRLDDLGIGRDGSIVAAGFVGDSHGDRAVLARFHPDGRRDAGFGNDGTEIIGCAPRADRATRPSPCSRTGGSCWPPGPRGSSSVGS